VGEGWGRENNPYQEETVQKGGDSNRGRWRGRKENFAPEEPANDLGGNATSFSEGTTGGALQKKIRRNWGVNNTHKF